MLGSGHVSAVSLKKIEEGGGLVRRARKVAQAFHYGEDDDRGCEPVRRKPAVRLQVVRRREQAESEKGVASARLLTTGGASRWRG